MVGVHLTKIRVPERALQPIDGLSFALDDASLLATTRSNELFVLALPPTGQALIDQAWTHVAVPGRELLTQDQRVRFALLPP